MEKKEMIGHPASGRVTQMIEILQMNNQDLNEYLKKLEMENPLVDLKQKGKESRNREMDLQRKLKWLDESDEQNRVYYQQEMEAVETQDEWNIPVDNEENLPEFVFAQLVQACSSAKDRDVMYFLTNSLDSRGYLTESMKNVMAKFELSEAEAYRYLYLLQSADPAGVGARNLRECLLLQLDRMPYEMVLARRIILECLELLGDNQIARIAIRLGISLEEAEENAAVIRRLNPKPGSGFSARENLRYLQPDVTVVKFRDYYQVMLNDTSYPKIHINAYYKGLLENPEASEEARQYIRGQIRQADWVKESIRRRGTALTEVVKTLVGIQPDFFEKGPEHRHSISMQELMDAVAMDEEELTAVFRDKYIQCHWGIYPLAFLLAQGEAAVKSRTQESVQEEPVDQARQGILQVIREEDKRHPLSDQKITDRLKSRGISISRRTVTQYRAQMGIPEARSRREWPEDE